jgi:hypothetical protein
VDLLIKPAREGEDENIPNLQSVILGKLAPSSTQARLVGFIIAIPTLVVFVSKSDDAIFRRHMII